MRKLTLASLALLLVALPALAAEGDGIKRMPNGKPDLSGVYDAGTVTPVDRPPQYGDNLYLTTEQAEAMEEERERLWRSIEEDRKGGGADRTAPKKGGDGDNRFGGGGVGGYNAFWIDRGTDVFEVDGKFRTSIIYEPKNGRRPAMTPAAMRRMATNFASFIHNNDGTASWLDQDGPGPFDGPETLALAERCLLGFVGGPPLLPSLYNNYARIMQTENHVVIMAEMVHDARIVPIDGEHGPDEIDWWLGDGVGRWDGDTLVVTTRNFRNETGLPGGSETMVVEERFTRTEDGNLLYHFRVDDPNSWTAPWAGEYTWQAKDSLVYEYACHEGNYGLTGILAGARRKNTERVTSLK
jgi:hypothetical protein